MLVDFKLKRAPPYKVAWLAEEKAYSDRAIRASFSRVAQWAASKGYSTGKWLFIEQYEEGGTLRWNACIEVKCNAKGEGGIGVKTIKSSDVVSVSFNPDEVSSRLVYHGINDWVRWRKKEGTISRSGRFREVYPGDPWKDASAWSNVEVQLTIEKGKRGKE